MTKPRKRPTPSTGAATTRSTAADVPAPHPVSAPLAPAQEQLLAELVRPLFEEVDEARSVLEAELTVSGVLGLLDVPYQLDDEDAGEELGPLEAKQMLVTAVVYQAQAAGGPDALATLRLLASLAPAPARQAAARAADELAAAGVPDRPWAARLGRPDVLRAWHWGDLTGEQESVGVLFTDRGRDHAISVLVDHVLGGGVKDVWLADGRAAREMHDLVKESASAEPDAFFRDVDVRTAAELLRAALASEPCPVDPEQLEDVQDTLALLRSRAARLAELAGLPAEE
ncbi:MAG: hypothetical protein ACTHOD_05270 [Motilibacteraceae bacterium]